MPKTAQVRINLVPKDPFLATPLGRFLQWALSVGRYVVIFTEMVVIISFATRFSLDRRVTDLNGQIHQKEVIIDSYGDLEDNVRVVQRKTESYLQVEQQFNPADIFTAVSEITPQDVLLDELQVQQARVLFAGTTRSQTSLNILINNIQLSTRFKDVSVEGIESESSRNPGFHFKIRAIYQPPALTQASTTTTQN